MNLNNVPFGKLLHYQLHIDIKYDIDKYVLSLVEMPKSNYLCFAISINIVATIGNRYFSLNTTRRRMDL